MINIITLQINSSSNIDISEWNWSEMIKNYTKDSDISVDFYDHCIIRSTISPEDINNQE
jgi:hypothetical protein